MKFIIPIVILAVASTDSIAQSYKYTKPDKGYRLNVLHQPVLGWEIIKAKSGDQIENPVDASLPKITLFEASSSDPRKDEIVMYFVKFQKDSLPSEVASRFPLPVLIGWEFELGGYNGIARNRVTESNGKGSVEYSYQIKEGGKTLTKKFTATGNFLAAEPERPEWKSQKDKRVFALIRPTLEAESGNRFSVANSYDSAAITLGIAQFSATDGKDLLALLTLMLHDKELQKSGWAKPTRWFPEFSPNNSKSPSDRHLVWSADGKILTPSIGHPTAWQEEDFMRILNPTLGPASTKSIDEEELHAIARWTMWSQFNEMQESQIKWTESIAAKLLIQHIKSDILNSPRVSGKSLSFAYSILHWNDGPTGIQTALQLLALKDPSKAFLDTAALSPQSLPTWVKVSNKDEFVARAQRIKSLLRNDKELDEFLSSFTGENVFPDLKVAAER